MPTRVDVKRIIESEPNVTRKDNYIRINRMDHPSCVSSFLRTLRVGIEKGFRSFVINWDGSLVYPDACVPIAGIIAYYREYLQIDFTFEITDDSYLQHCNFTSPLVRNSDELEHELYPFDKLYRYDNSTQVAALTQAYINCISRQTECSEGVITGLIWCLNEIMDNVLVHSEAGYGFVMAQYHQAKNTIAICVYDHGVGIFNSLRSSPHRPRNSIDAISLAIQEGVGDGKGQGNGLFGLYQIVTENNGALTITSGPASIMWTAKGEMKKFERLPYISNENRATTVDYRLKLGKNIDIQKAFKSIGGFDGFDIRLDYMIQDDNTIKYDVFSNSMGTATRESGAFLRNDILNTITRTQSGIILDFAGIKTVSSSFADELIAKLVLRLGILKFNQLIRLINMNDNIKFLCERSIYMRIHDEWEEKK